MVESYETLKKNHFGPLLEAVTKGPVGISVGTTGWQDYDGGVLGCSSSPNTVIGHAVLLVGYGKTKTGKRFWKVRNSWGSQWGEHGYVRLLMRENEHTFCGTNKDPHAGTGCDGGPSVVPVCGTCGILFDSVAVKGVHLVDKDGKKISKDKAQKHLHNFLEKDSFGKKDRDFFSAMDDLEEKDESESDLEEEDEPKTDLEEKDESETDLEEKDEPETEPETETY